MGWKNVKEHYRIEHIVEVREGKILISSPYVHGLIEILPDGSLKWGSLGPSKNDDLARYWMEMSSDLAKLKELMAAPDIFACSKPVFTFDDDKIIEKQCEEYGWPNVTHDGHLMYENTYSKDKAKAIRWAKENAESGIKWRTDRICELVRQLAEIEKGRAECVAHLESLNQQFP